MQLAEIIKDPGGMVELERASVQSLFLEPQLMAQILDTIATRAKAFTPNTSTATGRAEIAAMAHKVARSKTFLDDIGKEQVAELKERPKLIDAGRKRMRDYLDALKDEVRDPLTAWEIKEAELEAAATRKQAADALAAKVAHDHEFAILLNQQFDQQREAKRLAAAQAIKDHEAQLIRESEDRRKREATEALEKAKRAKELAAQKLKDAKLQAEREKAELEQKIKDAAKHAEFLKAEAEARAERDRVASVAHEKAAIEAERQRVAKQAEAEAAVKAKREANVKHRQAIELEAKISLLDAALMGLLLSDSQAETIITAIKEGYISHVSLTY